MIGGDLHLRGQPWLARDSDPCHRVRVWLALQRRHWTQHGLTQPGRPGPEPKQPARE